MLTVLLWSPVLLALLFPFAIQYERGGRWRWLLPLYAATALLSTLVNFTWLSLLVWELPRKREITTSQRCERLVFEPGWRGGVARGIAWYTNRYDPTPPHIKLP